MFLQEVCEDQFKSTNILLKKTCIYSKETLHETEARPTSVLISAVSLKQYGTFKNGLVISLQEKEFSQFRAGKKNSHYTDIENRK